MPFRDDVYPTPCATRINKWVPSPAQSAAKIVPLPISIHPREYEHPFDARALNALQRTPGLHRLVRAYNSHFWERLQTVQYTGSYLRISRGAYPKIYATLDLVCDTIHLPVRPSLYVRWNYTVNGETTGVENPIIVLDSGAVDCLDRAELTWLVGHEVGHIKSRHTLYHQMAFHLGELSVSLGNRTLGLANLLTFPVVTALSSWQRMSEFTADRAGLLACQDFDAAVRTLMKLAGVPREHFNDLQVQSFLDQAREFEQLDYNSLNKTWKALQTLTLTHPWVVVRAAQLLKWVESGEYQAILDRTTAQAAAFSTAPTHDFCRNCCGRLEGAEAFCPACGQQLQQGSQI